MKEAMADLDARGLAYNPNIQRGIMIEVPAAAMIADLLAAETNFLVSERMIWFNMCWL